MATLIEARPTTSTTLPSAQTGWAQREGLPLPLGVTWIPEERAYNFAIYSKHVDGVTLLANCHSVLSEPGSPRPPGSTRP